MVVVPNFRAPLRRTLVALGLILIAPSLAAAQAYNVVGRTDFPAGSGLEWVAIWDLNNDGIKDLVTANYLTNNISVLIGTGSGSFAAPVNYPVGAGPFTVVVTDLNNDIQADLLVANNAAGTISVLLGNGTGAFGARTDVASGTFTAVAATADFNGDGNRDVVTVNYGANNASIFLGDGAGGFAPRVDYTVGANPNWVAVGDFNIDGRADIVTANYGASSISILLGTGTGTLLPKTDLPTGTNPLTLTLAHLDGDAILDVATANYGANTISVRMGNGTGGFGAKLDYATGATPVTVTAGDLNLDGKVDLATCSEGTATISVLLNAGAGNYPAHAEHAVGSVPYGVAIGDVTGDGEPDIVSGNYGTNNVSVLKGDVPGGFRLNSQAAALTALDQNNVARTLSSSVGKWVVLDVCSVWCPPCNGMAKEVQQVYDTWVGHPTVQLEYMTILVDGRTPGRASTQANATNWANKYTITRPVLHCGGLQQALVRSWMDALGTNAYPTMLIIDPTGKIRYLEAGAHDGQATVDLIAGLAGVSSPTLVPGPGPPPPPPPAPLAMRAMSQATMELSYGAATWTGTLAQIAASDDLRFSGLSAGLPTGVPGIPNSAWIGLDATVGDDAVERIHIYVGTNDEQQLIGWAEPWQVRLTSITWPDGQARILDPSSSPLVSVFYYDAGINSSPFLTTPIEAFLNWSGSQLEVSPMAIGNVPDLPPTTNGFAVDGIGYRHIGTVDVTAPTLSARLELAAPYPNPARQAASLRWTMPRAGDATLEVYDISGRRVAQLHGGKAEQGTHATSWNLADESGARVSPGIYFVRFASGKEVRSTRLVVLE